MEKYIGLSGPDFEFPIELGKQREFASALHAFRPEFHDGSHPFMFPTLPIIAGYLWGYMLEDPKETPLAALGMDNVVSLDAEEEFVFYGKFPRAGETMIAKTSVDSIWTKNGRRSGKLVFYKMRTDFRDAKTNVERMTLFATSAVVEGNPQRPFLDEAGSSGAFMARRDERRQFSVIKPAVITDIKQGDTPGPIRMPPHTLTDCVRFQIVCGNYKGTHHDTLAAQEMGFPSWFGLGMYHAGLLANYAVSWLPIAALTRFKVRFLDTSWPGDILTYRGSVANITKRAAKTTVMLQLVAACDTGAPIIEGEAEFNL